MADDSWQMRTMLAQYGMLRTRHADDPNTFRGHGPAAVLHRGRALGHNRAGSVRLVRGPEPALVQGLGGGKGAGLRARGVLRRIRRGQLGAQYGDLRANRHPRVLRVRPEGRIARTAPADVSPLGRSSGGLRAREAERRYGGSLAVPSESLGLELRFEDVRLRLWDPGAQEYLLEYAEERDRRLKERDGRKGEHAGRIAAERRTAELEREVEALRERLR